MKKLGDLGEFEKNATQIMIFLPHYMWAENNVFSCISIYQKAVCLLSCTNSFAGFMSENQGCGVLNKLVLNTFRTGLKLCFKNNCFVGFKRWQDKITKVEIAKVKIANAKTAKVTL